MNLKEPIGSVKGVVKKSMSHVMANALKGLTSAITDAIKKKCFYVANSPA